MNQNLISRYPKSDHNFASTLWNEVQQLQFSEKYYDRRTHSMITIEYHWCIVLFTFILHLCHVFFLIIQRLFLDQFCCNFRSKTHIAMTFFVIILLYFLFIVFTHVDSFSGLPLQYSLTFRSKHSLEFFKVKSSISIW